MTDIVNERLDDGGVLAVEAAQPTAAQPTAAQPTGDPPVLDAGKLQSDSIKFLSLDPAFVTIERIAGWILTSCLLVAGLVAVAVIAFNVGPLSTMSACFGLAYLFLGALLAWATQTLPKKAYDHASWCLTTSGLEIRRGIWWRSQISVPLARVQHTDVHQGPLMRKFGLAKLIVHTAGTENSTVELNGLNFSTAQRLRDALVENRGVLDGV